MSFELSCIPAGATLLQAQLVTQQPVEHYMTSPMRTPLPFLTFPSSLASFSEVLQEWGDSERPSLSWCLWTPPSELWALGSLVQLRKDSLAERLGSGLLCPRQAAEAPVGCRAEGRQAEVGAGVPTHSSCRMRSGVGCRPSPRLGRIWA